MHLSRRAAVAAMAATVTIGLMFVGGTSSAVAAPVTPHGCAPEYGYSFYKKTTYFVSNPGMYKTRPGGDVASMNVTQGTTVHGEITADGGGKLGLKQVEKLIHDADLKVNAKISYTKTLTVTDGDRWRVPRKFAHGWLAFGAYGYQMRWELARVDRSCKVQVLKRGTTKLPAKYPGFDHGPGLKPPETR